MDHILLLLAYYIDLQVAKTISGWFYSLEVCFRSLSCCMLEHLNS